MLPAAADFVFLAYAYPHAAHSRALVVLLRFFVSPASPSAAFYGGLVARGAVGPAAGLKVSDRRRVLSGLVSVRPCVEPLLQMIAAHAMHALTEPRDLRPIIFDQPEERSERHTHLQRALLVAQEAEFFRLVLCWLRHRRNTFQLAAVRLPIR